MIDVHLGEADVADLPLLLEGGELTDLFAHNSAAGPIVVMILFLGLVGVALTRRFRRPAPTVAGAEA